MQCAPWRTGKDLIMMEKKISPSLMCADFLNLGEELKKLEKGGIEYLHVDIMDGHFVPNISYGAPIMKSLRKVNGMFFDTHLMISEPLRYIEDFVKAGADIITFHVESDSDIKETINYFFFVFLNIISNCCSCKYY